MAQRVSCAGGGETIRLSTAVTNGEPARTEIPGLKVKHILHYWRATSTTGCPTRMATPMATGRGTCRKAVRAESERSAHR